MEGDERLFRARLPATGEHLRRKVKSGGRRSDRASFASENGLVAVAVAGRIGAFDVGRQGNMSDSLERCEEIALAVKADRALAEPSAARRFRLPALHRTVCVRRRGSLRPGRTSASQSRPSAETLRSRKTSTVPLKYSRTFGLFFPMGSDVHSRAAAEEAGWKNAGIIDHQAIARVKVRRQVAEHAVFPKAPFPVDHQHARGRAIGEGFLGDQTPRAGGNRNRPVASSLHCSGKSSSCSSSAQSSGRYSMTPVASPYRSRMRRRVPRAHPCRRG